MREHLLNTGGSLFKTFRELDTDNSNFLTANELHAGLVKLGAREFSRTDADQVLASLDENGDGKVSYIEFASLLSSWSNAMRIDDPGHWAFSVFEAIRRRVNTGNKGLIELFGG